MGQEKNTFFFKMCYKTYKKNVHVWETPCFSNQRPLGYTRKYKHRNKNTNNNLYSKLKNTDNININIF